MNFTVALQPDLGFAYTNTLLFGTLLVLLVLIRIFWAKFRRKRPKKNVAKTGPVRQPDAENRYDPKKVYLKKLKALDKQMAQGEIMPRACFQKLSGLLRSFVQEMTGIDVTTKTLLEIRMMGLPGLEKLMEEYYEAEFGPDGGLDSADPRAVIEKTKKVIETWK